MTRRTLAVCCAPQVLVALDFALLAVAAPGAQAELGLTDAATRWLFSAYSLAFGCLLLPAGRLADTLGRGRLLRAGLALFVAAGGVAAVAPSGAALLAARVAGGAGAAAMTPAALSLITASTREGPERRAAMSAYGAAIAAGFVAGALAGGALSTLASWRPLFAAEAGLGLATLALAAGLRAPREEATTPGHATVAGTDEATPRRAGVATLRRAGDAVAARRAGLDVRAAALGAAAVGLALAPLPGPWRAAGLVVAAASAWGFWRREQRAANPLLPLDALARGAVWACAAGLTLTATGVAATVLLTSQLQGELGFSPLGTGAVLAVFGSTALPGAWLVRRSEPATASRLGLLIQGGALVAIAASLASGAVGALVIAVAAFGMGHVAANAGVAQLALRSVPTSRQGAVGATLATSQYLGAAAGPLTFGATGAQLGIAAAGCAAATACLLTLPGRRVSLVAR